MRRAYLTPLVIAGLLFLPSCSNAEAKACEAAREAHLNMRAKAEEIAKSAKILGNSDFTTLQSISKSKLALKTFVDSYQIIVNNQKCFTAEQVVSAQNVMLDAQKYNLR